MMIVTSITFCRSRSSETINNPRSKPECISKNQLHIATMDWNHYKNVSTSLQYKSRAIENVLSSHQEESKSNSNECRDPESPLNTSTNESRITPSGSLMENPSSSCISPLCLKNIAPSVNHTTTDSNRRIIFRQLHSEELPTNNFFNDSTKKVATTQSCCSPRRRVIFPKTFCKSKLAALSNELAEAPLKHSLKQKSHDSLLFDMKHTIHEAQTRSLTIPEKKNILERQPLQTPRKFCLHGNKRIYPQKCSNESTSQSRRHFQTKSERTTQHQGERDVRYPNSVSSLRFALTKSPTLQSKSIHDVLSTSAYDSKSVPTIPTNLATKESAPSVSRSIFSPSPQLYSPYFSSTFHVNPMPFKAYLKEINQIRSDSIAKQNLSSGLPRSILRTNGRFCKRKSIEMNDSDNISCSRDITMFLEANESIIDSDNPTTEPSIESVDRSVMNDLVEPMAVGKVAQTDQNVQSSSSSGPFANIQKKIVFDPRVWVREYVRPECEREATWYKAEDMLQFKNEALKCIIRYHQRLNSQLVPTGTGRMMMLQIQKQSNIPSHAIFSHKALMMDVDSDIDNNKRDLTVNNQKEKHEPVVHPTYVDGTDLCHHKALIAGSEVRRILIIDPKDVCRSLFTKYFQLMFPSASIVNARSSEEALKLFETSSSSNASAFFDLIIVEQRLHSGVEYNAKQPQNEEATLTGSSLIRQLMSKYQSSEENNSKIVMKGMLSPNNKDENKHPARLFVGCTANFKEDSELLKASGADFVWSKPPPRADSNLRDKLLFKLLNKRGKNKLAQQLFDRKQN